MGANTIANFRLVRLLVQKPAPSTGTLIHALDYRAGFVLSRLILRIAINSKRLDEDGVNKALASIERNARVQTQLIDDLLDVSRIVTGKLRLDINTINLTSVVMAAVDAVKPAAEAKEIRLQTLLDPNVGLISGDSERLQ